MRCIYYLFVKKNLMAYAKSKVPKQERLANLEEVFANLEEIQSTIAYYGLVLVIYGLKEGETNEWQFVGEDGRIVFQYWPTTKNSQVNGSGKYRTLSGWEEAVEIAIESYFSPRRLSPR